ncbi:MAG: 6-hydroxymethylpterin diphosphokinase MptE-like protein [Gammaproteobacteria bacterium]
MIDNRSAARPGTPTINPYRTGLALILKRLVWDLHPSAWVSRSRLRSIIDSHKGRSAIILCNGPSLHSVDLESLHGIFTFGLNKINLIFDRNAFRPTSIVSINELVIQQNADFFNTTDIPLFIDFAARRFVKARPNVTLLHSSAIPKFARDCRVSICQGSTVTFVAMQLAFHMGFQRVALVGCDHTFAVQGPANTTVIADGPDRSHFDPRYFSAGQVWQLPDLTASEYFYALAAEQFRLAGRTLVNCTSGGRLELLERCSLTQFLSSAKRSND